MPKDRAEPIVGILLSALSLLLVVGLLTFAAPCGSHDDGSVGTCVWAARATMGVGAAIFVLAFVRIFERDEGERRGLSLACACLGILAALVPGLLIDLCTSASMVCQATMRPFVVGTGLAIALVGGGDLVLRLRKLLRHGDGAHA